MAGDELRTGWYSDQTTLVPGIIGNGGFGQIFSAVVDGQVYAQPLVSGNTVLIVTETNHVYGIDAGSGAINWTRALGNAFASTDIGCPDLAPSIGISGTPVIDQATNAAYFFSKAYVSGTSGAVTWTAHAVDVATGNERAGFPVAIAGTAANDPASTFTPRSQAQRTGLLLLDGVVYAGFGSHCDLAPWSGWVVGVSTAGVLKTMWTTSIGGGIWQAGSALVSDGDGQILFATGNGNSSSGTIPGKTPPKTLGESIVRLTVQADGSLKPADFFSPYDAQGLDGWDADFGAGGPVGLPAGTFGTTQYPHLMVAAGKEGYVYLLDRDNLGGIGNGPSASDAVVSRIGPNGGVWSRAAVWPGDGGLLFIPTASGGGDSVGSSGFLRVYQYGVDGTGKPSLSLKGTSSDRFGYTTSAPIVTSNGTQSGTALVWIIWAPGSDGTGAQLRAYDPLPVNGVPQLRFSAPIGTSAKFVPPGVGAGRLYIGTRDGHVLGFGTPTPAPLTGSGTDFGTVLLGQSATATLTVTATAAVTVTSVSSGSGVFAVQPTAPALPAALSTGGKLSIPIIFTPTVTGMVAGTISLATSGGAFPLSVAGRGVSPLPALTTTPAMLSLGGTQPGGHLSGAVSLSNTGGTALTINSISPPGAPFGISGAPAVGSTLASGAQVIMTVTFDPQALGTFNGTLAVTSTGGNVTIPLTGLCAPAGHLTITPPSLDFGTVGVGATKALQFTITNDGGGPVNILKSKPPALGVFVANSALAEGTTMAAGASLTETITYSPTQAGAQSDSWTINGDDTGGLHMVAFTGAAGADLTAVGTPIALIMSPTGGSNHNLSVIHDGIFPAQGSTDVTVEYDTYNGDSVRAEDWLGYQFGGLQTFGAVTFQGGVQFFDGGWFVSMKLQVRQNGVWTDVPGLTVTPAYPGNDGVSYRTFQLGFPAVVGDAIRVDGVPGGRAHFISCGELRVYGASGGTGGAPLPPVANAGVHQAVASSAAVTLNGTGSVSPSGAPLTYVWTQTAGPTVALSSATVASPTFVAPSALTAATDLTFSLTVNDGTSNSAASTVTVSDLGTDATASATAIALITSPTGGGNHSLAVISDGVLPPVGGTDSSQQYDTYTGDTGRTEDWIGYQFAAAQTFSALVFQGGKQFSDGGWFTSVKVQARQAGVWKDVIGAIFTPSYAGNDGVNFKSYQITFPGLSADAIRIDGAPGGTAHFVSVGELRAYVVASGTGGGGTGGTGGGTGGMGGTMPPPPPVPPVASAAAPVQVASGAVVTMDGSASTAPSGKPLTYAWTQTAGPAVTLSSATAVAPTFTAPVVTGPASLTFGLTVSDGTSTSAAATATVVVLGSDITAGATPIALVTAPAGGSNHNLGVIQDGVFPPQNSTDLTQNYDTWTGDPSRTEDWVGYQFASAQTFSALLFENGQLFSDGGWFSSIKVQVRQSGVWTDVAGAAFTPAYAGNDGVSFRIYRIVFPAVTGDAIRVDGAPGGASAFISVAELRVYNGGGGGTGGTTPPPTPSPPVAVATAPAMAASGAAVTLDGSGSTASAGMTLTYAWTQTAGPAVTLSSASVAKPTFTAPTVTTASNLTFSLIVNDGTLPSAAATATVQVAATVTGSADITASGQIIALITKPTGGGNHNLEVIRDGVFPPLNSTNNSQQYDTYTGDTNRKEDWIGYQYSSAQKFASITFQGGVMFFDGGWFTSWKLQVRQDGVWVTVPGVVSSPAYAGNDGVSYRTYQMSFPPITGDGIRIDGAPGGRSRFISVGEMRVFRAP
ncbi:MAG TPA: choice-of-anchor D domain-containing protein [Polyangia bacterium]|nr:choice-of-anchor D domain-containing protein [Polyangia bacterium]